MSDETKKTIDDGGPAFPLPVQISDDGSQMLDYGQTGMSLRMYLAAKALPITLKSEMDNYDGIAPDRDAKIIGHKDFTCRDRRREQLRQAAIDALDVADALIAASKDTK